MSPAPRLYTPSGESVNQQTLKKNIKKKGGEGEAIIPHYQYGQN